MGDIEHVEVVERWVFDDLSSSTFSREECSRPIEAIEDLETDLVTWNRPIHAVLQHIEHPGSRTVYRHREGDLRLYFIRDEATMYCIGVGKRKNTYERDIGQVGERADNHEP